MIDELITDEAPTRRWERFLIAAGERRRSKLRVSITRRGIIQLNAATMEMLGHPKAAGLHFERGSGAIGIEPRSLNDADTFRVRVRSARGYGRIAALPSLRKYRVCAEATIFTNLVEIENGMLVIQIDRLPSFPKQKVEGG